MNSDAAREYFSQPPEKWRRLGRQTGIRLWNAHPNLPDDVLEMLIDENAQSMPFSPERAEAFREGMRAGYHEHIVL